MNQSDDDTIDPLGSTTIGELDTAAETMDSLAKLGKTGQLQGLADRYELLSELASGGMGTVWLATDRLLAREVAVKILHRKFDPSHEAKVRFEYEARLTGRLDHPGIVPVYDLGQLPDGRRYFAMRRIQGSDLRDRLDELKAAGGQEYPLQSLLRLFGQICMIVAYAHDQGFIHRDLKPANILVGNYGELYVADWGIAKTHLPADHETDHLMVLESDSEPGALMGTVAYMSPEQVRGEVDKLTPQSDAFSLGSLLYEIITGRRPFSGDNVIMMMRAIADCEMRPMTVMPDGRPVPAALIEICTSVLKPLPEERLSVSKLAERVTAFLDGIEDRRRAVARAKANLEAGQTAMEQYQHSKIELAAKIATIKDAEEHLRSAPVLADAIESGEALGPYLELWRSRHQLEESNYAAEHLYTRAVQSLEKALDDQDLPTTRGLLADLYWEKFVDARRSGDQPTALYFKALVLEHDLGQYADRLAHEGTLAIKVLTEGARVRVERYIESGPLLMPQALDHLGPKLAVGPYRLCVEADGFMPAFIPFVIEGRATTGVVVDLPRAEHPDFRFIQGGAARLGGDGEAPNGFDETVVEVSSFLLGENPITVAEYVDFLDALAKDDVVRARRHAPRSPSGTLYIDYSDEEGRFIIPMADNDGDAWDPAWPIMMLNQLDALAYCAWRGERDGVPCRLPTEEEWEYAARGVDGRVYPWGNGYDRLISCSSRGVKNDKTESGHRSGPARVDEFPYDVSPFGVRNMGGMAIEWTSSRNYAGNTMMRGGGLFSTAVWCRAATRYAHAPEYIGVQFGFRIARDIA
jgi:eukaryotic-like serine/threonine-protein kinase